MIFLNIVSFTHIDISMQWDVFYSVNGDWQELNKKNPSETNMSYSWAVIGFSFSHIQEWAFVFV